MKLLFDANISWRLLNLILVHFPDSVHVDNTLLNKPANNTSTQYLSKVLIDHKPEILQFSASEDLGILEIY